MEQLYFSNVNFKKIYTILYKKIKKQYNISIRNDEMRIKEIIDIMKYIYSKIDNFKISKKPPEYILKFLNKKTIDLYLLFEEKKNKQMNYEAVNSEEEYEDGDVYEDGIVYKNKPPINPFAKNISEKTINSVSLVVDLTGKNNYHKIDFEKELFSSGDAYIQLENSLDKIISIKINKIIIDENPIFREKDIADEYLENISGKFENIKELNTILQGENNLSQESINDLSGEYNFAYLNNFNISGVDVQAAVEYANIKRNYLAISSQELNLSGYLTNFDLSTVTFTVSGNTIEEKYLNSVIERRTTLNKKNNAIINVQNGLQKKADSQAIWENLSGIVVINENLKDINVENDVILSNIYSDLIDISGKYDKAYIELIRMSQDTQINNLVTDILTFSDMSGYIYKSNLEKSIHERDVINQKKITAEINVSGAYQKKIDTLKIYNSISGTNTTYFDMSAEIVSQNISGELDNTIDNYNLAITELNSYLSHPDVSGFVTPIYDGSGAEYKLNLEKSIVERDATSKEKQRASEDVSEEYINKTKFEKLFNDISGDELTNNQLLKIDAYAETLVEEVYRDYLSLQTEYLLAKQDFDNLSGGISDITDISGAQYKKDLEIAILERDQAAALKQQSIVDLSGAYLNKINTENIWNDLSGYLL